jgi:predicted nucleic acid-binding protein
MNAVDTNVLLYVHDPRDATKQATAANLLQSLTDGVLLWQVTCEYLSRLSMQLIAGHAGKNTLTKKAELCASSLARLAHTDIQQVSLRVAKLVLPVATASKQVHDDLILGFDVRGLGSQILRVVLRQQFHIVFESF